MSRLAAFPGRSWRAAVRGVEATDTRTAANRSLASCANAVQASQGNGGHCLDKITLEKLQTSQVNGRHNLAIERFQTSEAKIQSFLNDGSKSCYCTTTVGRKQLCINNIDGLLSSLNNVSFIESQPTPTKLSSQYRSYSYTNSIIKQHCMQSKQKCMQSPVHLHHNEDISCSSNHLLAIHNASNPLIVRHNASSPVTVGHSSSNTLCSHTRPLLPAAPHRSLRHLSTSSRSTATQRSAGLNVFDRGTKLLQRERAAAREDAHIYDYLKDEVGYRLSDRIYDIKHEVKVGLDLGCGRGHLSKHITDARLSKLYMGDLSPGLLASAVAPQYPGLTVERVVVDEEARLPFDDRHLDIVLSNLSLHWVNNLPGCLREVYRTLREDGVLLASMFGGDTLFQLRSALLLAEMEREGGMSAHVSPFTEAQDIGSLLTNAGFTTLTIDTEDINVGYPSMFELMWDLQGMAENNANNNRKLHLPRDTMMAAAAIYQEMYGQEEGIPATFQIIYMIGWKPNPNNVAVPVPRGSGQVSLKEIGRLEELIKEKGLKGKMQFIEEMSDNKNKKGGDK